ncbi:MAG TPA: alpha/beta hydrolase [Deltaproteobacteria bacterium]|nr:alpha/beta hydrolase [Deltaproteobacteria bacterium]
MSRRRSDRIARLLITLLLGSPLLGTAAGSDRSPQTAPSGEARTVVLLHGLGRSARNMLILEWRLEARGYRVCNLDYDSRAASIGRAADQVWASLRACAGPEATIDFVTHSLGGLVLRALLERHEIPGAHRVVMLAPPNGGSEIVDRLRAFPLAASALGPLGSRLGTGEKDLPRTLSAPGIPFGVIAGSRWINPAGPLWLPGPHDGTVSVTSTRLEGMSDHLVLPHTHSFIMNAAEVADQIDAFLRRGRFLRRERGACSSWVRDQDVG